MRACRRSWASTSPAISRARSRAAARLLRERPDMPLTLFHLAHLERENGNLRRRDRRAAQGGGDRARQLRDGRDAWRLSHTGGPCRRSHRMLEPFARREDADVEMLTSRALALAKARRFDEALATLSRASREDPSNARLLLEVGTIHLMAGHPDRARQAWNAALALNPSLARAHTSLGLLSIEDHRPAEAVEHWKAASALDPREHATILGIGLSLANGRPNGRGTRRARVLRGSRAAGEVCRRNRPGPHRSRELAIVPPRCAITRSQLLQCCPAGIVRQAVKSGCRARPSPQRLASVGAWCR